MQDKTKKFLEIIFLIMIFFVVKYLFAFAEKSQVGEMEYFLKTIFLLGIFNLVYLFRYFVRPSYEDAIKQRKRGWKISGFYSNYSLKTEELYNSSYDFWVKINLIVVVLFEVISIVLKFLPGFKYSITALFTIVGVYLIFQIFCWIYTAKKAHVLYQKYI